MELGMLINFGTPSLTYKRMINLKKFELIRKISNIMKGIILAGVLELVASINISDE
jgi:hypothetical protein